LPEGRVQAVADLAQLAFALVEQRRETRRDVGVGSVEREQFAEACPAALGFIDRGVEEVESVDVAALAFGDVYSDAAERLNRLGCLAVGRCA